MGEQTDKKESRHCREKRVEPRVILVPNKIKDEFFIGENMDVMEKIVALCKRRGFIYPGSEIYSGLAGTWDYGPAGVLLKKNLKDLWWRDMVQMRSDIVGVDAAIMMNPKAWEASGHVAAFSDPLVECKDCQKRFRADHLTELIKKKSEIDTKQSLAVLTEKEKAFLHEIASCKKSKDGKHHFSEEKKFNLLVKAYLGVIEGDQSLIYLRGEITNGVHVNFKSVLDSTRIRIPFGIAQVGKAFRNEITPGNFTFRSREFEQMEVQFYIKPEEGEGKKWFEYWKAERMEWYRHLGLKQENLRFRDHASTERAHYAQAACDIVYKAPWGWAEFMGIHHRGDWDLKRHQEYSGKSMKYRDPYTNEEYLPWDIETSAGVDRSVLFFLIDSYYEDEKRIVLKLHPKLAPYKVAVFPLVANKPELVQKAREVYELLTPKFMTMWDDRGNIGKRYLAQDEIGTPWCVTIDYTTLTDDTITIRERDTGEQTRYKIGDILGYISPKLEK